MSIKGLQLAARFSLPPNSLGYCGRGSAPEKFKKCVIHGDSSGVADEIKKFIVEWPYLKTLALITGKQSFSEEVVEGYWIGNESIKKAGKSHYLELLKNFEKQGVPNWLVKELRNRKPSKFIPTHLFQVLHVGVGRASGSVPFSISTINNCMIRWGRVMYITKKTIKVRLHSLKKSKGNFVLTKKTEILPFAQGFVDDVQVGAVVTAHWKQIVKVLNPLEQQKITFWTKAVLEVINVSSC